MSNLFAAFYGATAFLVFLLGIIESALEDNVKSTVALNPTNWVANVPSIEAYHIVDAPQDLVTGPTTAIFLAGALAICSGLLGLLWTFLLCQSERHLHKNRRIAACAISTAITLAAIAILIYVFVKESDNPTLRSVDPYDTYTKNFTRESWVCTLKGKLSMRENNWAPTTCGVAQAGRWLLVPLVILSAFFAALNFGLLYYQHSSVSTGAHAERREMTSLSKTTLVAEA